MRILFTQCALGLRLTQDCKEALLMPVIPRLKFYEDILLDSAKTDWYQNKCSEFSTNDELLLLLAQKLRREGKIENLIFVSICQCGGDWSERNIVIDEEGEFTDDPHHGFFGQRLDLLR